MIFRSGAAAVCITYDSSYKPNHRPFDCSFQGAVRPGFSRANTKRTNGANAWCVLCILDFINEKSPLYVKRHAIMTP